MHTTTIGWDIAKASFQVYGIDARREIVLRKHPCQASSAPFFANLPPCGGYQGLSKRTSAPPSDEPIGASPCGR